MRRNKIIIGIAVLAVVIGLTWAYVESTKPLPGVEQVQADRTHIPEGSKTDYKFSPPTGGAHYPVWITKGVYDTPRADGYLVHSLEHGYIIFWYDCEKKLAISNQYKELSLVSTTYAQGIPMATAGNEGSPSASLTEMPKGFRDGSCNNLVTKLRGFYNEFGQHKLIVVPRVGMAHPLVLTAWGRSLSLDKIDKDQVKRFIQFYRDHGPEATNEP